MIKDLLLHPDNDCEKSSCWSLCKTCLWEIHISQCIFMEIFRVFLRSKMRLQYNSQSSKATTEWMNGSFKTWAQCLKGIRQYFQTPVENWIVGSKEERDTQFGNPWNWHKYQELFVCRNFRASVWANLMRWLHFFQLSVVNYMSGKPKTLWLDLFGP